MSTRVVVLGAGPAGVGAAYAVRKRGLGEAIVVERAAKVGGLASSFDVRGVHVDFGSHRLHPACAPAILADIRGLLGDDLLDRPRHGRIRLQGRWVHFPLSPVDAALHLPPSFLLSSVGDQARKALRAGGLGTAARVEPESFASVIRAGLGDTICRDFYFPYARKMWGEEPTRLSAIQARRRIRASSALKLARKLLNAVPGFKPKGAGRFYYPRRGFGQIAEAYAAEAERLGAQLRLETTVERVVTSREGARVEVTRDGAREAINATHVWSTIPVTELARLAGAPADLLAQARDVRYRSMVLIYVALEQDRFTEFDAHYFPEEHIPITRLSEPKNYSATHQPSGVTVLCAELPCSRDDRVWSLADAELGELVLRSLRDAGLPTPGRVLEVVTRRLSHAYPIYDLGYETKLAAIDAWVAKVPRVLTLGRQGLFAHDNTHHTLAMAYAAADCLGKNGSFDETRWATYRGEFETHVVED